ncbi:MAG TPA: hypothetical protein VGV14_14545 [Rhodanobacter sp.]|nr:hypothetical protein [Rhodanobacter sp.]
MAFSYRNAAGLNPEDVYDPDVIGDGPDAAISGIGYRNAAGVLLRFAALKYGSAAANHGYRLADGRDFSALWAKKGTASYNDAVLGTFGPYNARSSSSHDTGASFTLVFKTDGTFAVTMTSLQGSSKSGTPTSGGWHKAPAAGVGNGYEIQFIATMSINNGYVDSSSDTYPAYPSYTATTGWLPLSAARTIAVDTGHLLGGSVGKRYGSVAVSGTYTVNIRKIGFPQVVATTFSVDMQAMI